MGSRVVDLYAPWTRQWLVRWRNTCSAMGSPVGLRVLHGLVGSRINEPAEALLESTRINQQKLWSHTV
jgi:hypothetical protein